LLTTSFPYVRDWLNKHPFKNTPQARLICSLRNSAPIKPEALWVMMKQLKQRIESMVENQIIKDPKENERLVYLLRNKKWNPYCLRHSAITFDSDYLPEFAVKKKRDCPRCSLINTLENKYCSKCSYPLVPDAFNRWNGQLPYALGSGAVPFVQLPRPPSQIQNQTQNQTQLK
jgi:integrase/recombinase XerD